MPGTLIVGTLGDGSQSKSLGELLSNRVVARVSFKGQGAPLSFYESDNVSSITDLGVGYYQINFTKAIPTQFYTVAAIGQRPGIYSDLSISLKSGDNLVQTTTGCQIVCFDAGAASIDPVLVSVAVIT